MRSAGLIVILILVWLVFDVLTDGLFLSSRNLTNLGLQVSVTAILAAGVVVVMVPGHIDLSIGAVVAFCAIIAASASSSFNLPVPVVVGLTMLFGLGIGAWHGVWVSWMRVPAFIVTLASLLGIRGLALLVTQGYTPSPSTPMLAISDWFIPAPAASILLVALFVGYVMLRLRYRRARLAAGIGAPIQSVVIESIPMLVLCLGTIWISYAYEGLPLPIGILFGIAALANLILNQTRFGRHLFAMGGNPRAARLSGIRTAWHSFSVFVIMGSMYAVAGLISVARLDSAPPAGQQGLELQVIAAAVIGGTSLLGGAGTVTGALLGAVLTESLNNGMSLLNLPTYYQQIVVGLILLFAVYFDLRARHGRRE